MNRSQHKRAIQLCSFLAAMCFFLSYSQSCSVAPVAPEPVPSTSPSQTVTALPSPTPQPTSSPVGTLPQPLTGWPQAYSDFVFTQVPDSLLSLKTIDFCPGYTSMAETEKRETWAMILKGIALPESGWKRTEQYKEPGMKDKQGRQVYSEGLLQLSYQDSANYGSHAPTCQAFNRDRDEGLPLGDRSIMNPYYNLGCGLEIMARLISRDGQRLGAQLALAQYWSTMRMGKCEARKFIQANTKCGQQPQGCK